MHMYFCVYIVSARALNICIDWFGALQIPTIIIIIYYYHFVNPYKMAEQVSALKSSTVCLILGHDTCDIGQDTYL